MEGIKPDVNIKITQEDNEMKFDLQATHDGSHMFKSILIVYWHQITNTVRSTDTTVNTNLADFQLVDTSASAIIEYTGTNQLSLVCNSNGMPSEPFHVCTAHKFGAHSNIGSTRHVVVAQQVEKRQ